MAFSYVINKRRELFDRRMTKVTEHNLRADWLIFVDVLLAMCFEEEAVFLFDLLRKLFRHEKRSRCCCGEDEKSRRRLVEKTDDTERRRCCTEQFGRSI